MPQLELGASDPIVKLILGGKKIHRLFPGVLLAVVFGIVYAKMAGYSSAVIGEIPSMVFPPISFDLPWSRLPELIIPGAIIAIVGPEVVTGSTRLKAGTATKMILNMITTGAMIRIGKTYGNLMVDLKATNDKLRDRSERIVVEVCGVSRDEARELLAAAGRRVKTAIVMQKLGVDRAAAEAALERVGGVIRRVVSDAPPPVNA